MNAQRSLVWTEDVAAPVNSIAVDRSGNIYVAGYTAKALSAAGSGAAFIRKYDANRHILWTRQFGTQQNAGASSVRLDVLGNPHVAGYTEASRVGPPLAEFSMVAAFVRKYDPNGAVQWTEQCSGDYFCKISSLAVAPSGNAYGAALLDQKPLVLKLDVH